MRNGVMVKNIDVVHDLKSKEVALVFGNLAAMATKEVKKIGAFITPGLCRIETRVKPATKAGMKMSFGQVSKVQANVAP